jgi:hypothetical protein
MQRWPDGPLDYYNVVVAVDEVVHNLVPDHADGWLTLYEPREGHPTLVWLVHRDNLGPIKLGDQVDGPPA